jgi:hypothetical protein
MFHMSRVITSYKNSLNLRFLGYGISKKLAIMDMGLAFIDIMMA